MTRKLMILAAIVAALASCSGCLSPHGRAYQQRVYVDFVVQSPDVTLPKPEASVTAKVGCELSR
jgi:hypothetical protein